MSILGVVVRLFPAHREVVLPRLQAMPGVDVALDPGDGRLVLVIEDAWVDGLAHEAAAAMTAIAAWPEVLNTSLVYEHSGDRDADPSGVTDYRAWRSDPGHDRHAPADATRS